MDSAISPLAQKISNAIDAIQSGNAQASPSIADISSSITNQANTIKSTVSSIKSTWKATSKKVRRVCHVQSQGVVWSVCELKLHLKGRCNWRGGCRPKHNAHGTFGLCVDLYPFRHSQLFTPGV